MKPLKSLFRIQYASDLHLEHYDKYAFPLIVRPNARYLALAGDIGTPGTAIYTSFMNYVSSNWDRVFYVAGNREYYQPHKRNWQISTPRTFDETHEEIQNTVSKYKNISFLDHNRPSVHLTNENVTIIGSTLWSKIHEHHSSVSQATVPDYSHIPIREKHGSLLRSLRPYDTSRWHMRDKALLETQIDYWKLASKSKIIMLTHHVPSFTLISPKYSDCSYNYAYASSCDQMFGQNMAAWIYGHTHAAGSAVIQKTLCVVNAYGYPNQEIAGYLPDAWIEIDTSMEEEESDANYPELAAAATGVKAPSGD